MLYPTPLPRGTTPPAPHHTPPAHPPAQTPHEPSDGQCWTGASPGWGRGGVLGLAPPLYSGLPNEVRPWKAFFLMGGAGARWVGWGVHVDQMGFKISFHGIQGAVVVLGFETVSDAVDPHG